MFPETLLPIAKLNKEENEGDPKTITYVIEDSDNRRILGQRFKQLEKRVVRRLFIYTLVLQDVARVTCRARRKHQCLEPNLSDRLL